MTELEELRQRITELESALNELSLTHLWQPGVGGCRCEEHKKAYELLKGTEYEDQQRRNLGWL